VPHTASELRWPPEVPVSLLLGGLSHQRDAAISDRTGFLPVYDYFLLPTGDSNPGQWYLITPFLKTGTLENLAERIQNQSTSQTAEDVDSRYRPSFNRLLKALRTMHQYELCHDDIKMDNIFVTDSAQPSGNTSSPSEKGAHWLLGDLGNTRHANHSYHTSLLWAYDNGQNTDCRTNDVVRLLKSYLLFLQAAGGPGVSGIAFNRAFLTASASWSRLYWYTINSARGHLDGATAARQILKMSAGVFAPAELLATPEIHQDDGWERLSQPRLEDTPWSESIWPGPDGITQEATLVAEQLRMGMRASERWARIYGTLGILPVPSGQC
jgi:serine/threonine protein kinase